ncbi:MAG: hypothetical protein RIR70_1973, partial [Pseudomonadota bacterium]
ARLSVSQQGMALSGLQVALPGGGGVSGGAEWQRQSITAKLGFERVDLRSLHSALAKSALGGAVTLSSRDAHTWRAEGVLSDTLLSATFLAEANRDTLNMERVTLKSKGGEASARGWLKLTGDKAFAMQGALQNFDPSQWAKAPRARLNATLNATGSLAPGWQTALHFALHDSRIETPSGPRGLGGEGTLSLSEKRLSKAQLHLDLAGNQFDAHGAFGRPGDVLEMRADWAALERLGLAFGGRLKGSGTLSGRWDAPALVLDMEGEALRFDRLRAGGLVLRARLDEGAAGAVQLSLKGDALGFDDVPLVKQLDAKIAGSRAQHEITVSLSTAPKLGGGDIEARARGGLKEGFAWAGMLEHFAHRGAVMPLTLEVPARVQIGAGSASLGLARLTGKEGGVVLEDTRMGPEGVVSRGRFSGLGLGVGVGQLLEGGLRLGGAWDVKLAALREAKVSVFRESGDIGLGGEMPVSLGLSDLRLDAEARGTRAQVKFIARGARLGELSGNLAARVLPQAFSLQQDGPVEGSFVLAMPMLDWLGPIIDPNLKTAGSLNGQIRLTGTPRALQASGELGGRALQVALIDQGLRLEEGALRVKFSEGVARVEADFVTPYRAPPKDAPFEVQKSAGRVRAEGVLNVANTTAQLDFSAERATLLAREGQWLMASGEGTLRASREGAKLSARTKVDAAFINYQKHKISSRSADVVVLGREAPASRRFRLDVDAQADMGSQCYLRAQGLATRLEGLVRLRAQGSAPLQASGSIRAVDGVFDAYGQTLTIDRGLVNFQGPIDNPGLNVRALRKGLPVEAGVEVTGTAQAPKVRLVSDPNVSDAEKLSWIVLGRG